MNILNMGLKAGFLGDSFAANMARKLWLLVALPLDMPPHRSAVFVLFVALLANEPIVALDVIIGQWKVGKRRLQFVIYKAHKHTTLAIGWLVGMGRGFSL